jgi:hypothetical protein
MKLSRARALTCLGLGVSGLVVLISYISVSLPASADDGSSYKCNITKVEYHNKNAPASAPQQFDATQEYVDKITSIKGFYKAFCDPKTGKGDPNVAASVIETHKAGGAVTPEVAARAQKTADAFAKDLKSWNEAVNAYMASIKGFDTVNETDGTYVTYGQEPGNPPTLKFVSEDHPAGWVLIEHYKDGTPDDGQRIVCGYQPHNHVTPPSKPPSNPQPNCTPKKSNNYCGSGGTPNCKTNCSTSSPPKTTCENSKKFGPGYFGTYPNCTKGAPPGTGSNQDPSAPGKLPSPADTLSGQCWLDGVVVDEGTPGAKCH